MRCGVVLFDSANNLTVGDRTFPSLGSAWASVGGQPSVRITSIHDLSSDVLWITNLTEEQFYRAPLTPHPNFRSEAYLRSHLRHLYSEMGVDPLHVSPHTVAAVLATVAQRLIDLAETDYSVRPRSKALNEDFAQALAAPRSQIPPEMYSMFEGSAQHAYVRTVPQTAYFNQGQTLTLRRNRVVHAVELLAAPVPPDSSWEYLARGQLPSTREGIEAMLDASTTAFLVRCEVTNVNPLVAPVFSVGNGARAIREWLTDVEWRHAREWAHIEYNGLLRCTLPSQRVPQADALPKGEYAPLSMTYSLAAEQIWTAMSMKRGPRDDQRYTAAAAWFRALDRMAMFRYAQQLHAKGLTVWGYGGGNCVVLYPEGGLRHALNVSTDVGLLPPASKLLEARRGSPRDQAHAAH